VIGVLDVALEGRDWLVGGKCTFADLAFLGWDTFLPFVLQKPENEFLDRYTNYGRWVRAMMARAAVKKVLVDEREKLWHVA
jgi:glutathione S-transferase